MITGSIVALVTPMTETGDIDWAALERLIDWHIANGTQALGLVGTTGEASTLSHPEHREVIRFGVSHAGGRIPIMAGTGSNSTLEAVELTVSAAEAGADCALLVTPYYNRPTQEGLYQHFKAVAGAINLPIVLYNVPSRTGCDLSVETTLRLSQIENIVGLKDATGDVARGAALIQALPKGFAVYSGDDSTTCDLLDVGAAGCISVTANVAPAQMADMCKLALAGDMASARAIDDQVRALHGTLFIESNPIPVKYAMGKMGLIEPTMRLPLTPLSETHWDTLNKAIDECIK
ncbi:4-hydroxy-tetrahydrodipicolinate synthase [Candidatus Paraluminiphilus aquimaris]|uniref:4-hydroxy-tetrahydrodipicolinate synthase n=1 Tax=Candidatus Paraluminiphilus aquimaris TaxID=2518994 RepID=A0ABY6Q8G7_9GAMM|nr:4-hydroxy-tetrahydrodipicolinate synthase [Candidatus Paraluminiphilus aquimaris]UZP75369.1 4-hydroxy-tetrahydrodipicolinate synthase [Candidatus Paraluminiphilus aquimaris]